MSGPLAGIRVVTLEQAVAAPFCSRRLAEAGADVIKVERPEGDFARNYDSSVAGGSSYFVWLNYGKRSIVLDLREAKDVDTLRALTLSADVFIQNLKPGALDSLGVPIESLRSANPGLITCSIAGYSSQGPSAAKKAYDLLIQAETGLASITGSPHEPGRVGVSVCDIACGMFAYDAILLALIQRGARVNSGADTSAHLEVTLFDALAQWMAVPYLLERYSGQAPARVGIAHPGIAPYGVFVSGDGQPFVLSIQNEREWAVLCREFLRLADWVTDARTRNNEARIAHRTLVDAQVAKRSAELAFDDLSALLLSLDIAHAPVNEVSGLRDHPDFRTQQIEFAGQLIEVPVTPGSVPLHGRVEAPPTVPQIGEHTNDIIAELGERRR